VGAKRLVSDITATGEGHIRISATTSCSELPFALLFSFKFGNTSLLDPAHDHYVHT
jgi:hypothetical protein